MNNHDKELDYIFKTGDLIIDCNNLQIQKNNTVLNLPDLSLRTLMVLVENAPNPISTDQLTDQVWENIEVSPETVTQRIALLRKSLKSEDQSVDTYITTVRSKGYRWVPEVTKHKNSKHHNNKNKHLMFGAIFTLLLCAVLSVIFIYSYRLDHNNAVELKKYPKTVNSTENQYLKKAWKYLDKHDLKSNQLAIGLFRKSLLIKADNKNDKNEARIGISLALSHQVTKFNQDFGLLKEAKDLARMAVDSDPKSSKAWVALAFVYDARGEIDKAITLYEKALELNPSNASIVSALSYLYGEKGRLFEAMKLNISVLNSNQTYLDLQIANTLDLLGFNSVAENWYQRAEDLSPDNVFITHQRARFYISKNQNNKAKMLIQEALNRGVERPELFVVLGIINLKNSNNSMAKVHFQQALEVDPQDIEAQLWNFIVDPNSINPQDSDCFYKNWFDAPIYWPNEWVLKSLFYAHINQKELALKTLKQAFEAGYRNHQWLTQLPVLEPLKHNEAFQRIINMMRDDIQQQKQDLLNAKWLPASFLDPQTYL